jgi:hypothetical protein
MQLPENPGRDLTFYNGVPIALTNGQWLTDASGRSKFAYFQPFNIRYTLSARIFTVKGFSIN